ncbi:MAG: PHP domain-containing protein [Acidimicrobiales bacterium]
MTPLAALERVVYLLDRALAPAPKVRAFQKAAQIVAGLAPGELDELIRTGRVTELAGIGASTGAVIMEAARGEVPEYIRRLEADTEVPLAQGAALRAALRGDCHTHSTWSDGGASVRAMAAAARALGHEYLVVTDHSPRLTVAHGLTKARLEAQLAEIAELNEELAPFRILTGMEVDILEDGSLDMDDDTLASLDLVVASVHSKLRQERSEMTRRMVLAAAHPHVDVLGHCTNRKVQGNVHGAARKGSTFDAELVFAACAKFGAAVEMNCRPERQDPPEELLALALEWGCEVIINTDAHAPGQLEWLNYGADKAVRCEVPPERVLNVRSADELLAWTRAERR